MVGEVTRNGRLDEAAIGETPNLAARLQAVAHPGAVVISPHTQRLLGGLFELTDLGNHEIKGFSRDIRVWEVAGESSVESRFQALRGVCPTPMIGRSVEMDLLLDRWQQSKGGEGQVVLLTGLPGLGKSRLIHALLDALSEESYQHLQYHCSPYHTNSALHPVVDALKRASTLKSDEPNELKVERLEQLARRTHEDISQAVPLLASLLSVPCEPKYAPLSLSADAQKAYTFDLLIEQITNMAAKQPVLTVLEDAHWLDPSSRELFSQIADCIQTLPVLLLVTSRNHEPGQIGAHAHLTSLSLNSLTRRQVAAMIREVSGSQELPPEIVDHIQAKTDGIPLFIEELTKMLLKTDVLKPTRNGFSESTADRLHLIPTTLQDLLMARLESLPDAKELAQVGAVIGREFSYDFLSRLAPYSGTQLQEAAFHLIGSELVISHGTPPEATFRFRHAFIQEAAHESLLKSRRRELHAKLADILITQHRDLAKEQPEVIAQHLVEGDRPEEATEYWRRAGLLASRLSSASEAAVHFRKALEQLHQLPPNDAREEMELELLTLLGSSLVSIKGAGAAEVASIHERAAALYKRLEQPAKATPILQGLRLHFQERADLKTATAMAAELMLAASETTDPSTHLEAHRAKGVVSFFAGDFQQAYELTSSGLDSYEGQLHEDSPRYENDARMTCAAYAGRALFRLGYADSAVDWMKRAVTYAEAASHTMSYVEAMTWSTEIALYRGDYDTALKHADTSLETAKRHGLPLWTGLAVAMGGSACFFLGNRENGIARLREGVARLDGDNQKLLMFHCWILLLQALIADGQLAEGAELADRLEREMGGTGVSYLDAQLSHLRGELYLRGDEPDPGLAESYLEKALAIAHRQGARALELPARLRLSELWLQQGQSRRARQLLEPLYTSFDEGKETEIMGRAAQQLMQMR
ncbi:ATP-binding protein [Fodinicurvata halophila]|uniref:ATP-binding protein n=1 Tax=Fodinicurvata halophila TaxID=1419723 RepID=UPI00362DC67B